MVLLVIVFEISFVSSQTKHTIHLKKIKKKLFLFTSSISNNLSPRLLNSNFGNVVLFNNSCIVSVDSVILKVVMSGIFLLNTISYLPFFLFSILYNLDIYYVYILLLL